MTLVNLSEKDLTQTVDLILATDTDYRELDVDNQATKAIAIEFPSFGDGRGFSLAVRLRKDFGFTGEIRATGNIMPEQALYLSRAGFDSVEVLDGREEAYAASFKRYGIFYQFDYASHKATVAKLRDTEANAEANAEAKTGTNNNLEEAIAS